jgi:hypothetical protein
MGQLLTPSNFDPAAEADIWLVICGNRLLQDAAYTFLARTCHALAKKNGAR